MNLVPVGQRGDSSKIVEWQGGGSCRKTILVNRVVTEKRETRIFAKEEAICNKRQLILLRELDAIGQDIRFTL